MRRPGRWPLLWGCLLGASAAVLWGFSYGLPRDRTGCPSATCVALPYLAPGLLTAAAVAAVVLGLTLTVRGAEGIDRARRPVVDQSMTTAVVAFGMALMALGGAVGTFLVWIGLGVTAGGLAGLLREQLALRELRRRDPGP